MSGRAQRDMQLAEAAAALAANEHFKTFMERVRDMRETAIQEAYSDLSAVANDRTTVLLLGEVRAYDNLVNLCRDVGIGEPVD
jgi:hypothetical protein